MMQTVYTWSPLTGEWLVHDRRRIDAMPRLDEVAEQSGIDAHQPIRVEITRLHDILATLETYRPCLACTPEHAPVLVAANADPAAGADPRAIDAVAVVGDVVTARQAAVAWRVSYARARRILAGVTPIDRDQMTGAMLYTAQDAAAARQAMAGQGHRSDLDPR